jgi:NAD(P)-dependent dehydrogenase (short-subunit alcohol dehydrogenase family)
MKALVTGAARGLGLGLCTVLAQRGYEVFAACRKSTPELGATGSRIVPDVDVSTDDAIARLRQGVGSEKLDLLICNAGLNGSFEAISFQDADLDMMAYEYQVNALGALRTISALAPALREGAKVIFITTGSGVTGKAPPTPGQWGYRMSKMALHTMAYQVAAELRPRGIAVRLISPGAVNTDLMKRIYAAGRISQDPVNLPSPAAAAERLMPRIDELSMANSGTWVNFNGELWS